MINQNEDFMNAKFDSSGTNIIGRKIPYSQLREMFTEWNQYNWLVEDTTTYVSDEMIVQAPDIVARLSKIGIGTKNLERRIQRNHLL